jgi:Xaa-Pro aminopeptidase
LDIGGVYKGYKSDLTRTVVAGETSSKQEKIFNLVLEAQNEAFRQIKAGIKTSDLDGLARKVIEGKGYGDKFLHGLGHGVGLNIHEPPTLSKSSKDILEEGNVVTVEPGVYTQGFGGVRIEDTVLVLRGSGEKLTKTPCTLMI